jgi:nicotinic acid phosphoribosyltransferase
MVAYAEFRQAFNKDQSDSRIVFYGMRYLIETYINVKWTLVMVEQAEIFYSMHNAGKSNFPFPKHLFLKFIKEHDGHFPCVIEALPEGSVCYPHVPVYQITTSDEYAPLCTWMETILTMVWYPSTVATLSRRSKSLIHDAFLKSVDEGWYFLLDRFVLIVLIMFVSVACMILGSEVVLVLNRVSSVEARIY